MEWLALRYEWLGALVLAILWTNVLLIAASAWKQRRAIGLVRDEWFEARRTGACIEGVVVEGRGAGGALASRRVDQVGRAITLPGPDRILFTDGRSRAELGGGIVETVSGETVGLAPSTELELWIDERAPGERAEREFASAWPRASTNHGFHTSLEQRVLAGQRVWIDRARTPLRLASVDPIAACDRARLSLAGFAVAAIVGCAGVTVIACWPPLFGTVSTLGGLLGVAYFLAIQPLGTQVRDAARLPIDRQVGGLWERA